MKITFAPILAIAIFTTGCPFPPIKAPSTAKPRFNLVGEKDLNGYMINPKWSGQTNSDCLLATDVCNEGLPIDQGCTSSINSIDIVPLSVQSWFHPQIS